MVYRQLGHGLRTTEGAIDTSPSGSGSVKDYDPNQLNMTPTNSPTYVGTQLKQRRVG